MTTSNNSQPPAAGEAAHTFAPTLPFKAGPVAAFGPGAWKVDIRDALNVKLCAVIERDFTPVENARRKAAFIVRACNGHADFVAIIDKVSRYLTGDCRAGDLSELESIICDVEAVRAKHGLDRAALALTKDDTP